MYAGHFFLLFFLVWIVVVTIITTIRNYARSETISSDGHIVSKEEDLTCNNIAGHSHKPVEGRYIVHNEPNNGYVVLNGEVKKIEDCKDL